MQHHSVVAVNWVDTEFDELRKWISSADSPFFMVSGPQRNGYRTVCLAADGAKEGTEASQEGDERRERFIQWLESRKGWSYFTMTFGDE